MSKNFTIRFCLYKYAILNIFSPLKYLFYECSILFGLEHIFLGLFNCSVTSFVISILFNNFTYDYSFLVVNSFYCSNQPIVRYYFTMMFIFYCIDSQQCLFITTFIFITTFMFTTTFIKNNKQKQK